MSRHRRQPSRGLPPEMLAGDELLKPVSSESSHASESVAASIGLGKVGSCVSSTGESAAGPKAHEGVSTDAHSPATLKKPPVAPKSA